MRGPDPSAAARLPVPITSPLTVRLPTQNSLQQLLQRPEVQGHGAQYQRHTIQHTRRSKPTIHVMEPYPSTGVFLYKDSP